MEVSELVAALAPRLTVLAGVAGLGSEVRWVHVTDLPDPTRYLRGGELVLTNGQWRRVRADSLRFVRLLVDAGVSAVGYGLQAPDTKTPGDLVLACEAVGLPLLEIPHDMAFVEISELVAARRAEQSQRRLLRRVRRDEALLTSVAGGGTPGRVLAILARDYDAAFLLIDHAGQTLGGGGPTGSTPSAASLAAVVVGVGDATAIEVGGLPVTVFPVTAQDTIEAYLIGFRGSDVFTVEERAAIQHELVFVGLELAQALATRELAERMVDELVELIPAAETRTAELAVRLRSLGVDATRPLVVIVLMPEQRDLVRARVVSRIAVRLLAAKGVAAVAPVDAGLVLVIAEPDGEPAELAADLLAALTRDGPPVSAGVGSIGAAGARGLARSAAEARVAADLARVRHGPGGLATHAQAGSHRVVLAALDRPARTAFVQAVLGPILTQDRQRGTQLLETLDAFVRDGGHWQRVATRLHLHVNTLRYRISRVERLTGRSLSEFEERVNFFLALEALREGLEVGLEDPPN